LLATEGGNPFGGKKDVKKFLQFRELRKKGKGFYMELTLKDLLTCLKVMRQMAKFRLHSDDITTIYWVATRLENKQIDMQEAIQYLTQFLNRQAEAIPG
jgi:hypothetical protein